MNVCVKDCFVERGATTVPYCELQHLRHKLRHFCKHADRNFCLGVAHAIWQTHPPILNVVGSWLDKIIMYSKIRTHPITHPFRNITSHNTDVLSFQGECFLTISIQQRRKEKNEVFLFPTRRYQYTTIQYYA